MPSWHDAKAIPLKPNVPTYFEITKTRYFGLLTRYYPILCIAYLSIN